MSEEKHTRTNAGLSTSEPDPIPNERTPVWELVMKDMQQRHEEGIKKYGTPLQAFNGRDPLVDAYQEVLDTAVYLRQAIEEKRLQRMGGAELPPTENRCDCPPCRQAQEQRQKQCITYRAMSTSDLLDLQKELQARRFTGAGASERNRESMELVAIVLKERGVNQE